MEVYFIRHGQSTYNLGQIINQDARRKVGLTELGRKQANEAGDKLKTKGFDAMFSSNFLRARETAGILSEKMKLNFVIEPLVGEWRVGFEGKNVLEYKKLAAKDPFTFSLEGKESWVDLKKRARKFVEKLNKKKYGKVLVVTHEHFMRAAIVVLTGADDRDVFQRKIGNCDYVEFII